MTNLTPEGQCLTEARGALTRATEAAKAAVRLDAERGVSEAELARRYGVDRMTIRAWLGKGK